MDKAIVMSTENTSGETCVDVDNTVSHSTDSEKVSEVSDEISKCAKLNTSGTALEVINVNDDGDDDIIIIDESTEKRSPGYETAYSRKRKNEADVEEVVFNYLTGMYEKVKKRRPESEDEVHEETEISTGLPNQDPVQTEEQPDSSGMSINCKSCQFKAVSKQQLKFHLFKTHLHGMYSVHFRCKICNFKTNYEKPMSIHQTTRHIKKEIEAISSDISLNNNVEVEIVPKSFSLDVEKCPEFESLTLVKTYRKGVYKCFDCKYAAKKRESLQNHVIQHYGSDFNCDKHTSLKNGCLKCVYKCCLLMVPYRTFKCSKCGFKTSKYDNYARHNNGRTDCTTRSKLRVQGSAKKTQYGTNKELKCYHCSYFADSRDSLKLHAIKHYKQGFDCDLHPSETDNECTKCLYKTVLEELAEEIEFSEHQNNIGNCETFQTINLCSDNSEDEEGKCEIFQTINLCSDNSEYEDCGPEKCVENSKAT